MPVARRYVGSGRVRSFQPSLMGESLPSGMVCFLGAMLPRFLEVFDADKLFGISLGTGHVRLDWR